MSHPTPQWTPSTQRVELSHLNRFVSEVNEKHDLQLDDYRAMHAWSVEQPELFWSNLWDYAGVIASHRGDQVLANPKAMPGAKWFPQAKLN
ncbi:MAG: acetyl-coenzyme A synthetase N-terminal domain-containing protein, partial [Gammaproteobacteria bacterium]